MSSLIIGGICIGLAPIFVRLVSMGPTPMGFYRCGFAALILLALISTRLTSAKFQPQVWPRYVWKFVFLAGTLFAIDLFVWHRSVIYAGAAIGTILGNTQAFYVALVGIVFFKERFTPIFLLSVLLAFLGIYLLVNFRAPVVDQQFYPLGVLCGLGTGVVYASYILTLRHIERSEAKIPTAHVLAVVSAISAAWLALISTVEGTLRLPLGIEWVWLILLALIAQVVGWVCITRGLAVTPVSRAGLILTLQPVVAVIGGTALLGERLGALQLLGAAITVFSIQLGNQRSQRTFKASP